MPFFRMNALRSAPSLLGGAQFVPGEDSNLLLMSMRRIAKLVAYCIEYEFEDVITDVTGADRVDVGDPDSLEWSRRTYKYGRLITQSRRIAKSLSINPSTVKLDRDYELFFPVFNHAHELYALATLPDWRKRSRFAACFVSELRLHQLPRYLLELLGRFDHIYLGDSHSVAEVAKIVGRPCSYLPLATDVLRFSPYPTPPARVIDLCSIGRRSQVTHEVLMRSASDSQFFYHYDTVAASGVDLKQRTFRVQDQREHRLLLASLLRRSRYCFAYRGFVNDPTFTKGYDEISARFYEAAAAGVVMLGEPANTEAFRQQFDWPDFVIPLPFDSTEVVRVIDELDCDPQRVARIRADNIYNAAMRHDWVYRLGTVFDTFGLAHTDAMRAREQKLQAIAAQALLEIPNLQHEHTALAR